MFQILYSKLYNSVADTVITTELYRKLSVFSFNCNANFTHFHSKVRARVRVSHLLIGLVLSFYKKF